mmetsp:Transcript_12934/g.23416  ORF Transcript_12934/g.23416 Transcript_12934/m.23416 type:complete len:118 (-) Transcript_12934:885-1238(-)
MPSSPISIIPLALTSKNVLILMKLPLPSVSIHSPTIAERIDDSSGILIVTDLPKAPFGAIRQLIQHSAKHANRLNKAYPKNLVYKDSFALGNDGPSVDRTVSTCWISPPNALTLLRM